MEKESKRFEDWIEVDCDQCERWWIDQCDGVKHPSERSGMPCNSFLATRKVVIPEQIKTLQKLNKYLIIAFLVLVGCNVGIWTWLIWRIFQ